jgi:ABC-type lipoprotein export system ATPase subunit
MALLVATHDPAITAGADEVYAMSDGRLHRP